MPDLDLDRLRDVAAAAAREGGRVIREARGAASARAKGPGDWVTEVDLASERAIGALLGRATPEIPVHGEETGGAAEGRRWLVDPLDGTTNFIHGFWAVGVSVALLEGGEVLVGAIDAPLLGTTWHAARGGGALVEDADGPRPCRVSDRSPDQAIVGTGFPFRRKGLLDRYLAVMVRALGRFEDLRRPGAASLDLAWVAAGVLDGFFELGLGPWDVAAGALLVREAGGVVTDWDGGDGWLGGDIVAGPPEVHGALLELVRG
ncbi:MAG: inositol monophosphatase [Actinomycetota bacterium]|nr:MAG: inositol monophosphatase [Actinomycetota bacterium]